MRIVNWKTTIGGVISLLAGGLPQVGVELGAEMQNALMVLGLFIVGIFAKDSNVTGGMKPNRTK